MKASASAGRNGWGMATQRAISGSCANGKHLRCIRGAPRTQDEVFVGQDRSGSPSMP